MMSVVAIDALGNAAPALRRVNRADPQVNVNGRGPWKHTDDLVRYAGGTENPFRHCRGVNMRIVFVSTAALAVALCASNALAQAQPQELSQPTTTSATTGPGTNPAGQLICRPVVYEGMVVQNKQDCHTQREWDSIRQRHRQQVDQLQLNNLTMQQH